MFDDLETKKIERIEPTFIKKERKYRVHTVTLEHDGMERKQYMLDNLGANPRFVLLVNNDPICTCTEYYTPIPNQILKDMMRDAIEKMDMDPGLAVEEYPTEHQYVCTFMLEENVSIIPSIPDDKYDLGVSITNSYDLSMGIYVMTYFHRLVCDNGLYIKLPAEQQHFKHMRAKGNDKELIQSIKESINRVIKNRIVHQKLLANTVTNELKSGQVLRVLRQLDVRKYEADLLEKQGIIGTIEDGKIVDVIVNSAKIKTEYDLINAITYIANDVRTVTRAWDMQRNILNLVIQKRVPRPFETVIL